MLSSTKCDSRSYCPLEQIVTGGTVPLFYKMRHLELKLPLQNVAGGAVTPYYKMRNLTELQNSVAERCFHPAVLLPEYEEYGSRALQQKL